MDQSPKSQTAKLISIFLLLVLIPATVGGVLTVKYLKSKAAYPVTPPVTPPNISWGKALHFDNSNSQVSSTAKLVRLGDVSKINFSKEFTLEFWFKLNNLSPNRQELFRLSDGSLIIFAEKDPNNFTRIRGYMANGSNFEMFYFASNAISANSWNHLAITYLPNFMNGSVISYLNGNSTYRGIPKIMPFSDKGSNLDLSIGDSNQIGILNGEIDELRISDIARYPYQSGPGTYIIPTNPFTNNFDINTIGTYHFDGNYQETSANLPDFIPAAVTFIDREIQPTPSATPTVNPTISPTTNPTPPNDCTICENIAGTINSCSLSSCSKVGAVAACGSVRYCCEVDGYWRSTYSTCLVPTMTATPRPSLIATPTAWPTLPPTPTATSTSTIKPSPTATPKNSVPVISTSILNIIKLKTNSTIIINGYDLNKYDKLTLTATGFPEGISLSSCDQYQSTRSNVKCIYRGIARRIGMYNIRVTLNDNKGGQTRKNLLLLVSPF